MTWFKNTITGVAYEIEGERNLDIAQDNPDLEELTEAPEDALQYVGDINAADEDSEDEDDTSEGQEDPLDGMVKADLKELAASLGVATSGKNVEQLKEAIRQAE
jgi:hypothetical protein